MKPAVRKKLLLLLCGVNLMLLQFVMLREFATLLTGIEIVVVLLSAAYFFGFSVGYAVSDRFSTRWINRSLLLLFLLHLTLPFSPRWLSGFLAQQGGSQFLLLLLLFIAAFLMSTAYSLFLPRLIEESGSHETTGQFYSTEILGSILGLVLLVAVLKGERLVVLMLIYLSILVSIAFLLQGRPVRVGAMAVLVGLYGWNFSRWDQRSQEYFFNHSKHIAGARSLYRAYSAYQKVDVVENAQGARFLYLNGLLDFNSTYLEHFNYFLSELPAQLQKNSKVLIVGSGSMSSVHHVAPYAGSIQTVEIDGAVAKAGRTFFSDYNQLSRISRWNLTLDDAKHFLGSRPEEKYDLIVMDVPAPSTIQEALLHSREFYELAGKHLSARGIISVSLSGNFAPGNRTPTAVAASLMAAFPQSLVVTSSSARRSFAMAGWNLDFGRREIEAILKQRPNEAFAVFDREAMEQVTAEAVPIRVDHMENVLRSNLRRLAAMMPSRRPEKRL